MFRITNNILFKNIKKNYQDTYNRYADNYVAVHSPIKSDMRFIMHSDAIPYYDSKTQEVVFMETLEDNSAR